jgi:ribosome maturation factor RimP
VRPLPFVSHSGAKLEVREEVRRLATPLAEESGYELVDVELSFQGRHRVVRVLIDKPGGVTVGDCGRFSRRLADGLDMNQVMAGSYQLEVSSPGIERPLRTLDAVARFAGQLASITAYEARDGRRNWEGVLLGPDGDRVGVRTDDDAEHWFEWGEVKNARLVMTDPWKRGGERPGAKRGGAR